MSAPNGLKVLLVEEMGLVRAGVRALLERTPGVHVVGEEGDVRGAVSAIRKLAPHVVVTALDLPDAGGAAFIGRLLRARPGCAVVVLSRFDSAQQVREAVAAGALGYVSKRSKPELLVQALKLTSAGVVFVDPSLGQHFRPYAGDLPESADGPGLSPRERRVLQLVAEGLTSKDIASKLQLSAKTVDTYRARIREKLGISARADFHKHALMLGLLDSNV